MPFFVKSSPDVFWEEPPDPDPYIFLYNVSATLHIAGSTCGSMRDQVNVMAENIRSVEKNEVALL